MMLRRQQRRGSVLIESALVYPVMFLIVLAIITLSLAVFRHQQVAHIAREAARWGAVRGAQYARDTTLPAATAADVEARARQQAVAMRLGTTDWLCTVTWNLNNEQSTNTVSGNGQTVLVMQNNIIVTVTHTYHTGLFGSFPLTSTAVMPISY